MLIKADISTNKTDLLIKKYISLLSKGINSDDIIFLTQNSFKKKLISDNLKFLGVENKPVKTFSGLIYNTVKENWKEISAKIKIGKEKLTPNLCSMELSQYIMKCCIDEVGFNDYFSKVNLLHQLLKNIRL